MTEPSPRKILVIEDDEDTQRTLLELLTLNGYQAMGADTGDAGLALVRSERPALVLLDLGMPGLSGEAILAAISADPQLCEIPVVIVSGHDEQARIRQTLRHGAADFISKPVEFDELLAVIHAQLEDHEQGGEFSPNSRAVPRYHHGGSEPRSV